MVLHGASPRRPPREPGRLRIVRARWKCQRIPDLAIRVRPRGTRGRRGRKPVSRSETRPLRMMIAGRSGRRISHRRPLCPRPTDHGGPAPREDGPGIDRRTSAESRSTSPSNRLNASLSCEPGSVAVASTSRGSSSRLEPKPGRSQRDSGGNRHHLDRSQSALRAPSIRHRTIRAGLPATIASEGTDFVTTLPAPMTASCPTSLQPGVMEAFARLVSDQQGGIRRQPTTGTAPRDGS